MPDIEELERALGYRFADRALLETALTHRSHANEQRGRGGPDNEKLEFLGDAVLDLAIGHLLMEQKPSLGEGELSVARAQIVSEGALAAAARRLGLGGWLRLGRGEEKSGGRDKPSLLADCLEAVIAAVYLDGGFERARELVVHLLGPEIAALDAASPLDHKTRLQERVQAARKTAPEYRVVAETGPDHDKTFEVAVIIDGQEWARAAGKSKKAAEQRAAAEAADRWDG